MARAPMNAVRDKKVCSRASREARMVNRMVEGIIDHPTWLEGEGSYILDARR